MKTGFDNELYVKKQTERITERIKMFDKLYLEFGGKLFDDYHAKRVLPGFELNAKIRLLEELKDQCEIIFCINAKDIERKKIRADYGITYDMEIIRLIKELTKLGISVNSVVITLYKGQSSADKFKRQLDELGVKTYIHTPTKGYPTDVDVIVSEEGYGANQYIETTKPLVVVNAPGPNSGKLATCLSQLYHEHRRGIKAGYAKFETFPVWDLPLKHPINVAYEAATADIKDVNMIDYFHLDTYGVSAINYNRDLEIFPVLKNILNRITKSDIYKSPTDMGVNSIGTCITDSKSVVDAAKKEVVRRYYKALCDYKMDLVDEEVPQRIKILMDELGIDASIREVIDASIAKRDMENKPVAALKLPNGKIITGKRTELLSAASSLIINCVKELTGISDEVFLLSPYVLTPILKLKSSDSVLNLQEVLISLSILSAFNPIIEKALDNLKMLDNCDCHVTYMLEEEDAHVLRMLKINFTSEPEFYVHSIDQSVPVLRRKAK